MKLDGSSSDKTRLEFIHTKNTAGSLLVFRLHRSPRRHPGNNPRGGPCTLTVQEYG